MKQRPETQESPNRFRFVIKDCFYSHDRLPGTAPQTLVRVTKKMGFLRDHVETHNISLARLCRDYSVVPIKPEFQNDDFKKPIDILEAAAAIDLAAHLYGYDRAETLCKLLDAGEGVDKSSGP